MKLHFIIFFSLLLFSCNDDNHSPTYLSDGEFPEKYFPTVEWRECSPEQVGMSSTALKKAYDYVAKSSLNTHGILIVKDGYIVCEAYFNGYSRNSYHTSYSIAKSFSSAAIGIAIDKEHINSVNDKIAGYFVQLQAENVQSEKKEVTIKHLLTMKAGFEWDEEDYYSSNSQSDIFIMVAQASDYIDYVLSKPIIRTPGTSAYYSSGESMLLSGIIKEATSTSLYSFAKHNLFDPIGIKDLNWDTDPSGNTIGGWGINTTLRNYARFGYLYLNKGQWDGNQIISESWVDDSVDTLQSNLTTYGYQWWIGSGFSSFDEYDIPEDTFLGIGIYLQYLIIIPSKNLVIVRTGRDIPTDNLEWSTAEFISLILDAIEHK
ncbi:serine hydrolase domain-containing protein [Bacteroidota bacterium]